MLYLILSHQVLLHRPRRGLHHRQNRDPEDPVHRARHPGDRAAALRRRQDQVLPTAQHEGSFR